MGKYRTIQFTYSDVIMGTMASLTIVYPTFNSGGDHRKHQSSASLAFVGGNSPVTCAFPAQRASNVENVSIWWLHHEIFGFKLTRHSVRLCCHIYQTYTYEIPNRFRERILEASVCLFVSMVIAFMIKTIYIYHIFKMKCKQWCNKKCMKIYEIIIPSNFEFLSDSKV